MSTTDTNLSHRTLFKYKDVTILSSHVSLVGVTIVLVRP